METPAPGSKHVKLFLKNVCFHLSCTWLDFACCLTWLIFFNNQINDRLNIFCSDHHNFNVLKEIAKKVRKEEHKNNFFVAHQIFSKIFHGPLIYAYNISWSLQKSSSPPPYILNVQSLKETASRYTNIHKTNKIKRQHIHLHKKNKDKTNPNNNRKRRIQSKRRDQRNTSQPLRYKNYWMFY